MITEHELLKIIRYAAKAPSGHNSQPWQFKINGNSVEIIPDYKRALPVVDPDNHALFISLGCALENFKITSEAMGYKAAIQFLNKENGPVIQIHLTEDSFIPGNKLFSFIEQRQVRRNHYLPEEIPADIISSLLLSCQAEGIHIKTFLSRVDISELKPFIIESAMNQFRNRPFLTELIQWTRFSQKEAMLKGDGIWTATTGVPEMGRFLGSFMLKNVVSATSEGKRWEKIIDRTAGLFLFSVEKNEPLHWIKLGQIFQRFSLTATSMGLSHAHANMPCEVLPVRNKMAGHFNLKHLTPLLLIRTGFSNPMPYSFRRHINETVL